MDLKQWIKERRKDEVFMKTLEKFRVDPTIKPNKKEKIILGMRADYRVWNNYDRTLEEVLDMFK